MSRLTPDRQPQVRYTNGRRKQIRTALLIANIWELFVCGLSTFASLNYFLNPVNLSDSSVGHIGFPDVAWNGLYGVGAVLVVTGLVKLSPRLEAAGLSLFASSVLIQILAIIHYRGLGSSSGTIAILLGFAAAAIVRIWDISAVDRRRTHRADVE